MNRLVLFGVLSLAFIVIASADDKEKEKERETLQNQIARKMSSLSPEAQATSKKFDEIIAKKMSRAETKAAMDKLMKSFPENIRKELEAVRPMKGGKPLTSSEFFDIMGIN